MVSRESGYGHVAYVEAVNPDGSWRVSEMNFAGWNLVSGRTIHFGQVPRAGLSYWRCCATAERGAMGRAGSTPHAARLSAQS